MSATNRGSIRAKADNYPTPEWATRSLLAYPLPSMARYFDPFAGDGAILRAIGRYRPCIDRAGYDVRPECESSHVAIRDSLTCSLPDLWSTAIVTNPPYSLAEDCIRRWAQVASWSAWLLRLNFLGGQRRASWLRSDMPSHVLVLPKRPAFVAVCKGTKTQGGCGRSYPAGTKGRCECGGAIADGTDATEYAWFVWGLGEGTKLDILEVAE